MVTDHLENGMVTDHFEHGMVTGHLESALTVVRLRLLTNIQSCVVVPQFHILSTLGTLKSPILTGLNRSKLERAMSVSESSLSYPLCPWLSQNLLHPYTCSLGHGPASSGCLILLVAYLHFIARAACEIDAQSQPLPPLHHSLSLLS